MQRLLFALLIALLAPWAAAQSPWGAPVFPQDADKWWWDKSWWERGQMAAVSHHAVVERQASYRSGDIDVPVTVHRPQGDGPYPVVVFLHGRRGLDDLTSLVPRRLAARGFIVVAPDLFSGRFIAAMPVPHDYALELDAARAIDFALALPEVGAQGRVCVVSHTRGGYYALKALVTHRRDDRVACYAAYYPHWQDPNAGEVAQVYQFAPEVEALNMPVLVFIGEYEQYQRARSILAGVDALRAKGRDARVLVYPGVGRGFEFRAPDVRSFADDLASKDALLRVTDFIHRHLGKP